MLLVNYIKNNNDWIRIDPNFNARWVWIRLSIMHSFSSIKLNVQVLGRKTVFWLPYRAKLCRTSLETFSSLSNSCFRLSSLNRPTIWLPHSSTRLNSQIRLTPHVDQRNLWTSQLQCPNFFRLVDHKYHLTLNRNRWPHRWSFSICSLFSVQFCRIWMDWWREFSKTS